MGAHQQAASNQASALHGAALWVVDDSPLARQQARAAFFDAAVTTFDDGETLLEHLGGSPALPHLLVLDLVLPGISGFDVCRFLRSDDKAFSFPILLVTADRSERSVLEAFAAGANDHVGKPWLEPELRARAAALVRAQRHARELREREAWLDAVVGAIDDAVVSCDGDGVIRLWNQRAAALTGWSPVEAVGRARDDVLVLEPSPFPHTCIVRHRHTGAVAHVESTVGALPGGGTVTVLRDVSARVALDTEKQRKGDFERKLLGIVSHDLRGPLNVITLGAGVISQDPAASPMQQRSATRIVAAAARATTMVRDLLDFTSARLVGALRVSPAPCNAADVASAVADEAPDGRVVVDVRGDPAGVWDRERMQQLLQNLVGNALKYGGEDDPVRIEVDGRGDDLVLAVRNRGQPIPAEQLPGIFEPLQRARPGETNPEHSIGLGLYIVRHIVEAHGGSIRVSSDDVDGTAFVATLPRAAAPLPRVGKPAG